MSCPFGLTKDTVDCLHCVRSVECARMSNQLDNKKIVVGCRMQQKTIISSSNIPTFVYLNAMLKEVVKLAKEKQSNRR